MKKIININLSGRVLPIEEPAYEQLQSYVASLRKQFANEESRDEIINDIEGRIAEILYDKIQRGIAFISEVQVEEVIALMGRPEEIASEEIGLEDKKENTANESGYKPHTDKTHYANAHARKFYRDQNNRMIAGVASGIANYANIDPAIIRVLFILLSLSSLGFVLLGYILIWILVPEKGLENNLVKRFYRNPDERVFGGVAGGLAAYFDKSVRTVRLIFLSPLLLQILFSVLHIFDDSWKAQILFNISLGSLTGFSIVLYIVLWIILPKAVTPYQKMEMRGEKVDAERIRRFVNEGAETFKEKVKDWEKDVEQTAKRISEKAEQFARETTKSDNWLARIVKGFFRGLGLLFKLFFGTVFGLIAFALLAAFIAILFAGIVSWPIQNYLWSSNWQQWLALSTLVLFFIVPVVAFIAWLIRRLIGIRSTHSYHAWTFGGLWTLGWVSLMLFVSSLYKDFQYQQTVSEEVPVSNKQAQTAFITVTQPVLEYTKTINWIQGNGFGWDLTPDTLKLSNVNIKIEPSRDSFFHVQKILSAAGPSLTKAKQRANSILYKVQCDEATLLSRVTDADSKYRGNKKTEILVVDLGNSYAIPANSHYRLQQVTVVISVPAGRTFVLDKSVSNKLDQGTLQVYKDRKGRLNGINWQADEVEYESDIEYFVLPSGELRRADGIEMFQESQFPTEPTAPKGSTAPKAPQSPKSPKEPTSPLDAASPRSATRFSVTPSPLNTLLWG
jgi:phage shock protein PspC (stress-responsive transcriptional regulator)